MGIFTGSGRRFTQDFIEVATSDREAFDTGNEFTAFLNELFELFGMIGNLFGGDAD